jgi:2-amino-4-hydroxy-6-hydroxymethyldihydropteridine diphosphokinase
MATVYLGLGSNLGDRAAHLRAAVAALRAGGVRIDGLSRIYESPPMGPIEQGPFLNAAVRGETDLSPHELLQLALAVEAAAGRVREVRWGPRTLDVDVLWYSGVQLDEPGLTVPHPGLAERAFVLRPLADLSPALVLPDGRTVAEALEALDYDECLPVPGQDLDG